MFFCLSSALRCFDSGDEPISDEKCLNESGTRPVSIQRCYVACDQGPCTFSEWSLWSPCSSRCHGVRKRSRTMEGCYRTIDEQYMLRAEEQCAI